MMGFTNSLWTYGKLGEYVMEGEMCKAQIQLTPGSTSNQLLSSVLPAVEIHSFREMVPSMNDIFIKKVSEESIVGTQSNFTE